MTTTMPLPRTGSDTTADWWTVPNLVTLARTGGAVAPAVAALSAQSRPLLVLAYLVYWAGDVADGALARATGTATRFGAVLDLVSDRLCTTLCGAALVVVEPSTAVPVAVLLVSFAVVDTMLSMSFLRWPIDTPNDFHRVDHLVWLLNWSPVAKAVNTAATVVLLALGLPTLALAAAVGLLAVKLWSSARVVGLLRADAVGPVPS